MFSNYLKIALRSILKNKLYAVINILGLAVGLAVCLFGFVLADYEYSHDSFFSNSDRTYTIRGDVSSQSSLGIGQLDGVQSAVGPLVKTDLTEIDAVARTIFREFLVSVGEDNYYENIRFTDPELLDIFDFNFLHGDKSALEGSTSVIISESMANKYFGTTDAIGQSITLDHEHDLTVQAVIEDIPLNSHFNSEIVMTRQLSFLVPVSAMERITGFQPDTNWNNTSMGNLTYIMIPEHLDQAWLQDQINGVYDRHYPVEDQSFLESFTVRKLADQNTAIWDAIGIPVVSVVQVLGLMVLFIACLNYTNLATAQSMGRAREVGLRKTLGAGHKQLLSQFITESLTITFIAMLLALAVLELIIPLFNSATGKLVTINYIESLPLLLLITITVGLLAGAYPSYVITKTNPIEALRDSARKGKGAPIIRAVLIGIQFTFSVCILAMVLVIYQQNLQVEQSSRIFPKDFVYTLDRLNVEQMEDRHETLRNQMMTIPYVQSFTLTSQVPYEQNNSTITASRNLQDFDNGVSLNQLNVDDQFVNVYEIPMIAGRNITRDNPADTHIRERGTVNTMINELAASQLGFETPQDAIGQVFYEDEGERGITTYTIVGVMEDRNILGLFNVVKPFFFFMRDASYRLASIKISQNAPASVVEDISEVWREVYPDYPMQGKFLDETFQMVYMIFDYGTKALAGFAFIALSLAAFGLFGLAAFMAEQKTREIGIRKVLGANNGQIVKLLIWQFSTPVLWATPIALGLAYYASQQYLNFFAERIGLPIDLLLGAGLCGLLVSWLTVATHAINVAKTNPVNALHYE